VPGYHGFRWPQQHRRGRSGFIAAWDGELQDCNSNQIDDLSDLTLGQSLDSNSHAVPDECEFVTVFENGFE
jgi:hypothetical protein